MADQMWETAGLWYSHPTGQRAKVRRYRPQYNTRHNLITMALEGGVTDPQVAKLVGNSIEIIL
ncbi:hypothetical protein [Microseira sp. BLCC-F43]|jgi:hypothetical protein|uniref:hypothetical protein n=1 Tax=Microseira sp. BLCC-F43 TaxID=3153602 RepID=UPI0035BA9382